ncbi:MAG: hypothetical protein KatS3mg109_0160 [Pirellulaceae bacterium]|nr:MAG: hypothetical protein KatS3mg109_0160 [Pirellulaceae bacterium]
MSDMSKNNMLLSQGSVADLNDSLFSELSQTAQYFAPGADVTHFLPQWTKPCPTIFMPIGERDTEGNFLPPAIVSEYGEARPTNFYMRLPIVKYVGSISKVSFVLFDPFAVRRGEYSVDRNPYIVFRNNIKAWVKSEKKPEWKDIVFKDEDSKESPPLPAPAEAFFFQGLVFQEGRGAVVNRRGLPVGLHDNDRWLPIIVTSKACGMSIVQAVMSQFTNEESPIDVFQGNPAKFFVIANPEKHPKRIYQVTNQAMPESPDESEESDDFFGQGLLDIGASSSEGGFSTYTVDVEDRVNLMIAKGKSFQDVALRPFNWGKIEGVRQRVHARWRPLHSVLRVTPHEEQVRLLCEAFADKPELVRAGFPESSEFYNEDVARVAKGRVSVAMPSASLSDDVEAATSLFGDDSITGDMLRNDPLAAHAKSQPKREKADSDLGLDFDW